jgi:hypothetical protein
MFDLSGKQPDIQLKNYQSYYNLSQVVKDVVSQPTDILVLFIRPFPLQAMIKPVIRYTNTRHQRKFFLHTAISNHSFPGDERDESAFVNRRLTNVRNLHSLMVRINIVVGRLLGLQNWAINYIEGELVEAINQCRLVNTKLIIAGPPAYCVNIQIDQFCARLSDSIAEFCRRENVFNVPLWKPSTEARKSFFEEDGIHFNEKGHEHIADSILNIIQSW